ncbi:MAG: tetratricopeptide repeat protein [bacterium]
MGQRQHDTASERAQDAFDSHLNPDEIGKFTNGELSETENQRVQEHLSTCDQCRRDLVMLIRLAAVEVTEAERKLLQSIPAFESSEQVRQVISRLPHIIEPTPEPVVEEESWWERLTAFLPASTPVPAFATVLFIFVALGAFGGYRLYVSHQINNDLVNGYAALKQNWKVSGDDFRPPGEFERSLFSREHGPAPVTDPAAQAFESVLVREEHNREALLGLAVFYSFSGRMAQADSLVEILLQRDSTDAEAWNQRGAIRARMEQFEAALAAFATALRHQPGYSEAAFNRALLLTRFRRKAEALAAWQEYLRRDPTSPWSEAARDHLRKLEQP